MSKNNQKRKKSMKKQNKSKMILILVGVTVIVFIVSLLTVKVFSGNKLDVVIGDEAVTEDEFMYAMNEEKYDVTKYFYREYGAEVNKDFWTSDFEGEIPYKMLVDNTIDSLLYSRANYEIAKENNYIQNVGYDALLDRFETENADRAEKIKNDEPVYGLEEYPLDLFIEYEMDALQKMYINDQSIAGSDISEDEAMSYYDENKTNYYMKPDDIELEFVKIRRDIEGLSEEEVREYEKDLISVYKKLDEETTLEQIIMNDYEYLQPYFHTEKILSEEVSARSRELADIFELSNDLKAGESTQVINQNETLYLIRIIEREIYNYLPFEQVKDNVLKSMREINFEEVIKEKMKELEVQHDLEKTYSFTNSKIK